MTAATALAGGLLLTGALPAAAAAEVGTVTITTSKVLAPWVGGTLWLKCPDSHAYIKSMGFSGPYTSSVTPPPGFPGHRQQATFFFNNVSGQQKLASAWLECTPVKPF